jgi:hypothetical protein
VRDGTTIRVLVANRPKFKLMCETRVETFAVYSDIAIVGEGAYNADIGSKSNRGSASRFSLYRRRATPYFTSARSAVQINRSAKY